MSSTKDSIQHESQPIAKQAVMGGAVDLTKTFIKYVLFHQWNRVPKESIELLENQWKGKPKSGAKLWMYNLIKYLNK